MNIQPVKSEGVPPPAKPKTAPARAPEARTETESLSNAREARLRDLLAQEPAVRAGQVERGKTLAADPGYPSDELLARLAGMFVDGSPK